MTCAGRWLIMSIRTSKPGAGNKFYITTAAGGYSTCIVGKPTDKECNVLANCVGYACGRFNEIIGSMKYPSLNCNAENFIERAQSLGLTISQTPSVGAIMCWRKGAVGSSSDGAGHVAIVERVDSASQVYTSESGYGSSAFWNQTRTKGSGNWGLSSPYVFRGFIVNPNGGTPPTPTGYVGEPVDRDTTKNQVEVAVTDLRTRKRAEYNDELIVGFIKPGIYNVLEVCDRMAEGSNGFYWYRVGEGLWIVRGSRYDEKTLYTTYHEAESLTDKAKDKLIAELKQQVVDHKAQVENLTGALEKATNDLTDLQAQKDKLQQAYSGHGEVLAQIEKLAKDAQK